MSAARTGKLTQFKRGDAGNPEVFVLVPGVAGTLKIGEQSGEIDVTSFDSTAIERIQDLPDGTKLDLEMYYTGNAQQDAMIADFKAGLNKNYQIYNPTFGKTYAVEMAPLMWDMEFQPKGKAITLHWSARISGAVVIS